MEREVAIRASSNDCKTFLPGVPVVIPKRHQEVNREKRKRKIAKSQRGEGREATRWEHWQTTDNIIPKEQHYSVDVREKEKK